MFVIVVMFICILIVFLLIIIDKHQVCIYGYFGPVRDICVFFCDERTHHRKNRRDCQNQYNFNASRWRHGNLGTRRKCRCSPSFSPFRSRSEQTFTYLTYVVLSVVAAVQDSSDDQAPMNHLGADVVSSI
jgi:hypothetical protein